MFWVIYKSLSTILLTKYCFTGCEDVFLTTSEFTNLKEAGINMNDGHVTFQIQGANKAHFLISQNRDIWQGPMIELEIYKYVSIDRDTDLDKIFSRLILWYNGRSINTEKNVHLMTEEYSRYSVSWWLGGIVITSGSLYREMTPIMEANWTTYIQPEYFYIYGKGVEWKFNRGITYSVLFIHNNLKMKLMRTTCFNFYTQSRY